jgi:hypothetical protein
VGVAPAGGAGSSATGTGTTSPARVMKSRCTTSCVTNPPAETRIV